MILKELSKSKIEYSDIIELISGNKLMLFKKIINNVKIYDQKYFNY